VKLINGIMYYLIDLIVY